MKTKKGCGKEFYPEDSGYRYECGEKTYNNKLQLCSECEPNKCVDCGHSQRHHGRRIYPKGRKNINAGVRCVVKFCKCKGFKSNHSPHIASKKQTVFEGTPEEAVETPPKVKKTKSSGTSTLSDELRGYQIGDMDTRSVPIKPLRKFIKEITKGCGDKDCIECLSWANFVKEKAGKDLT